MNNKIALITGAASGIGAATTRRLVADGARVLAVDINRENLENLAAELGETVHIHRADMALREEVEGAVTAAIEHFGGLDILVNNAGIGSFGRAGELDPEQWRQVMAVDLDAVFLASRVALPHLVKRRGCIVNTASISGMGADYAFTAYNTAKAAVINLTRAMAIDYARDGVRVNAVSPGYIDTPLVGGMPQSITDAFVSRIPMARAGRPEEIAAVIRFLASDEASYLTGQNLAVDGGITAHTGQPDIPQILANLTETTP